MVLYERKYYMRTKNLNSSDLSECGERQMEEKQEIGHMCVLALLSWAKVPRFFLLLFLFFLLNTPADKFCAATEGSRRKERGNFSYPKKLDIN